MSRVNADFKHARKTDPASKGPQLFVAPAKWVEATPPEPSHFML